MTDAERDTAGVHARPHIGEAPRAPRMEGILGNHVVVPGASA
jgi:hypothetical protein